MTSSTPLLSVRLSVDYRKKPGVLRNIVLEIYHGEIVGLVGESGSGKSTLALALLQLLASLSSRARIFSRKQKASSARCAADK